MLSHSVQQGDTFGTLIEHNRQASKDRSLADKGFHGGVKRGETAAGFERGESLVLRQNESSSGDGAFGWLVGAEWV